MNGGSITLNQVILSGNIFGVYYEQVDMKVSSLEEEASVNIFNSTIITAYIAIFVSTQNYQVIDINIDSVSVTGNGRGNFGICIVDYSPEVGWRADYATARIHNVTIQNFVGEIEPSSMTLVSAYPAAIYLFSLRHLTLSECTMKNKGVTGIVLCASTALLLGTIILTNNSGLNGGGMALYSSFYIVLETFTSILNQL